MAATMFLQSSKAVSTPSFCLQMFSSALNSIFLRCGIDLSVYIKHWQITVYIVYIHYYTVMNNIFCKHHENWDLFDCCHNSWYEDLANCARFARLWSSLRRRIGAQERLLTWGKCFFLQIHSKIVNGIVWVTKQAPYLCTEQYAIYNCELTQVIPCQTSMTIFSYASSSTLYPRQ